MSATLVNRKTLTAILLVVSLGMAAVSGVAAPRNYTLRVLKDTRKNRYAAETHYPRFRGSTRVVRLANYEIARWARERQQEFLGRARRVWAEDVPPMTTPQYDAGTAATEFQGPHLISVLFMRDVFLGGAHGMQFFDTFNYGIAGGKAKRLKLGDFFNNDKNYQARVARAVLGKLRKREGADWVQNGDVKTLTVPELNRFTLQRTGLVFHFNPYEMGPYAAGSFDVQLSLSDLGSGFKSAMLKSSS